MKNAITCLTRGYADLNKYDTLIQRNYAIQKFFGNKYPLLIFHEGNITAPAQERIKSKTPELEINFIDISDIWSGGYEGMCRFNAYQVWEVCKEYDNILRIDEDCHLIKMDTDPFKMMGGDVYLKSVYWAESHSETNATLPGKIESLTGESRDKFYNGQFPYTNVSLSSVSFWRQPHITEILKEIATCEEQRKNRWGDLPVLGSLLNIFAVDKVATLEGLSYKHISHGVVVHSKMTDHEHTLRNRKGFEGDFILKEFVKNIVDKNNFTHILEGGTYKGGTTKVFCEMVGYVQSIEINQEFHEAAKGYLKTNSDNVDLYLGSTIEVMPGLIKDYPNDNYLFFCDSHWGPNNPLLKELEIIKDAGHKPHIIIHDFKVPGHPELGFDTYGGQDYEWSWIESSINQIYGVDGYSVEYNSEAVGAKRGIIYISPK